MFEQSLILDGGISKKTGAIAASLTAQSLFVGVCILVPLVYHEALPLVRMTPPLALPVFVKPLPPEVHVEAATHTASRISNIFRAPNHVPSRAATPERIELESAPAINGIFDPNAAIFPASAGPGVIGGTNLAPPPQAPPVRNDTKPIEKPAPPAAPVAITSELLAAKLIKKVVPSYPALARRARISGTVRLEGVISKEGTIRNLQVMSGHPLLIPAALEAVKQWLYRPTVLNGQPVEVMAPIDVIFTLSN